MDAFSVGITQSNFIIWDDLNASFTFLMSFIVHLECDAMISIKGIS